MKRYFSLVRNGDVADIDIYGDITSWAWFEGEISAATLSRQLEELSDVSQINVHINSYGGEVAEGLAIYNALRRHSAKIVTTCDGMACSIASVIFMAGDERLMSTASLLMIHNAWSWAEGNADELRKQADDLDIITSASKAAYLSRINIDEEELSALMDAETWITPEEAISKGFATSIEVHATQEAPAQGSRKVFFDLVVSRQEDRDDSDDDEEVEIDPDEEPDDEETPDDEDTGGDEPDPGGGDDEDSDDEADPDDDENSNSKQALEMIERFFMAIG